MDVARTLTPGQRHVVGTLGPQGGAAAGSVEIYYNGVNHYDGSDATAGGTGTHGAPPGPTAVQTQPVGSQGGPNEVGSDDWSVLLNLDLALDGDPDADSVSVVRAVRPLGSDALVAGLLALPEGELTQALELLEPAHRRWLAGHAPFVDGVRESLPAPGFRAGGGTVAGGRAGRGAAAVSARHETYARPARMLQDSRPPPSCSSRGL